MKRITPRNELLESALRVNQALLKIVAEQTMRDMEERESSDVKY